MPIPVITSATRAGGNKGSAFTYSIVGTNSPTSYDAQLPAGGLPAGLAINTGTGVLSGTPTTNGIFTVHLTATNASGSGTANLDLHLSKPGAPVISSAATASGTISVPFTYTITGTNTPTTFNATSLPTGLSVNTGTGAITGTPTVSGSFSVHLTAANASGNDQATLDLVIAGAGSVPTITSALTVSTIVNMAATYQITASNTPTSFGATGLPAGLTVNTTNGLVSGTPTLVGSFTSTVSATNGSGTGTASVTFNILPATPGDTSGIPTGLSVLITEGALIPNHILVNPDLDILSFSFPWSQLEPSPGVYDFSYFRDRIKEATIPGKSVILRVHTGAGAAAQGGHVPDHILVAMGITDPSSKAIVPGKTYTFNKSNSEVVCFPVFFETTFVARKAALYAAMGDYITNTPELTAAEKNSVKIIAGSFANSSSEDWDVPHKTVTQTTGGPDGTGYVMTEVNRWLTAVGTGTDPDTEGAGYTTAKMITAGNTLLGALLTAFPGKYCTLAVAAMGTDLDNAASGGVDTTNYLPKTVANAVYAAYPGRLILQRNSVSAFMVKQQVATGTVWQIIDQWGAGGGPVGGQNLWYVWGDTVDTGGNGYRMNNGSADDPDGIIPNPPGLLAADIFRKAGDHMATYANVKYLEIYKPDALSQQLADLLYVKNLFFNDTTANPPVITSPATADMVVGVSFSYQIVATNNPTDYNVTGITAPDFNIDRMTGLITGLVTEAAVFTCTLFATNDGGTGQAPLTITATAASGSGGDIVVPVRVEAFPELSSFAEDNRVPCPNYAAQFAASPPSAPLNLVVTPPMKPDSGIATATWTPPLQQ